MRQAGREMVEIREAASEVMQGGGEGQAARGEAGRGVGWEGDAGEE